ncbi:hypothetical protein ABZ671_00640 [Micromonospora sp. NPDC006766]|uniref:hypothetical protein n=1 Tax=Micromonospora sp. NPDC006766 TaxID=3154778 RepID=UPI0033C6652E
MTSSLAAQIADRLRTHQWRSDPKFPLLHEPSAHANHQYNSDCAICQNDLAKIAAVVAEVARETITAEIAAVLRIAADGRREYAKNAPADSAAALQQEAATLDSAARVASGDMAPMFGWLPSWWWTGAVVSRMGVPVADQLTAITQPAPADGDDR